MAALRRVILRPHPEVMAADQGHGDKNVPENVPVNGRQAWFLEALRAGERPKPVDLAMRFGVTTKTAKRDVAGLKNLGLVEFVGPDRNGYYRLVGPTLD